MRWSDVQRVRLPRSGIGVIAPWLVIAPPGNPVVRLDLRLVDRVGMIGKEDGDAPDSLLLTCRGLEVALHVAEGPDAVRRIAKAAAPLTRDERRSARSRTTRPAKQRRRLTSRQRRVGSVARLVITSTPDGNAVPTDELAGTSFELSRPQTFIGRTDDNHIVIPHRSVSRTHAKVTRDRGSSRYRIENMQSTNAVRVNGEERAIALLADGDVIDLGHVRLRFESPDGFVRHEAKPASLDSVLFVGSDRVVHRNKFIQVGNRVAFRVNEVKEHALRGANLPLPRGGLLQAAMALLVVAAAGALDVRTPRRRPRRKAPRTRAVDRKSHRRTA